MQKSSVTRSSCGMAALWVLTGGIALADAPLGIYVAGSIGQATVRTDLTDFSAHHFGWDVALGIRPISLVGVELAYIDFGHPASRRPENPSASTFYSAIAENASQKATDLTALVFMPLPSQSFDVYGRAGIARLQTSAHSQITFECTSGPCPDIAFAPQSEERAGMRFAYGIGAQAKLAAFNVRLDYQRIGLRGEDPDLLSVGLAWRF